MARSVWSGSITFGLVTLPVSMTPATTSHTIRFRRLERGTSDRVRNKRVNERTGKEVPYDKIVSGYEVGKGRYVAVEPEELDEVTPGRSQSVEINGFVQLERIDPVYFDTTYFLQPRQESDSKVYELFRQALEETGRAGIATMSMRQKDHLVAVHSENGVLVLHTLHWADEVRDPGRELGNLPKTGRAGPKEKKMARQLLDTMMMDFDPEEFTDRTHERVQELVEAKESGSPVEKGEPAPEPTGVVDLMLVLRRSVEEAEPAGGGRSRGKKRAGRKKTAAKSGTDGLAELTKQQLYDRAAEAGIGGRSRMNREDLLRALRERGGKKAA